MTQVTFRSDMTVALVKHSASDMDVVAAARVSTTGAASLNPNAKEVSGLINFLARERHGSPFEHSYFTFYVEAPIFVWREHMRHRIASYNEESGRYKVLEPVFYVPDEDRPLVQIGKTGAYEFVYGTRNQFTSVTANLMDQSEEAYARYKQMLDLGIAKEVARMTLPVNIYSSAYVTMNARALMNFLSLRTQHENARYPSYPQREIEMIGEQYETHFASLMPVTHAAFCDNGRVAP